MNHKNLPLHGLTRTKGERAKDYSGFATIRRKASLFGTMLSLFLLLLLSCAWFVTPSKIHLQQFQKISHNNNSIFILAGQSNMAGRGGVINGTWDGIVPTQCQPNPRILRLTAGLEWEAAHEPLHADIDVKTCGVGPGMAFANAVLTKEPRLGKVGLVPCAVGGTKIDEWGRGGRLYNELVKRAGVALVGGGSIRAILWYQGETDTVILQDAEVYKQKLKTFFSDLRSDLKSPSVPIFQVALASGQGPYTEIVREAQLRVSAELQNVKCVDAKGLPLEPDGLHLSMPAQVRLGEMLADAFLQSIPSPMQSHAPTREDIKFSEH
ncbi:probable carbohydrate esterase At4g34215 isoform X2 [Cornus florida]|uniref:probable carbohydrate esterase At4g34215 isoform X2 n=1 Tax=Cornus florida TaxID=4283 RepID=UPI00289D2ACB|nr:probable carbohydrate esterase At4g34215 isoform X2 [Cornus florida]